MAIICHGQLFYRRRKILHRYIDFYNVLVGVLVMIGTPHCRVGVEDHRPFVFLRNGKHGILSRLDRFAAKADVFSKYKNGGFICPAPISLAIRCDRSPEDIPALLIGTAVIDSDVLPFHRIMRAVRVTRLRIRIRNTTNQ